MKKLLSVLLVAQLVAGLMTSALADDLRSGGHR